jgi:hypothetical protein
MKANVFFEIRRIGRIHGYELDQLIGTATETNPELLDQHFNENNSWVFIDGDPVKTNRSDWQYYYRASL